MEQTENVVSSPDEFLNNISASTIRSVTLDETETQGGEGEICDSSRGALENQAIDVKASDENTTAGLNKQNDPPVDDANGDSEERDEKDQSVEKPGQVEGQIERTAKTDDDSGTEEDTTQENNEVPSASEELDIDSLPKGDRLSQSEDGTMNEQEPTLEPTEIVVEDVAGDKGNAESATESSQQVLESLYHIKWIKWKGINTPIITQNENGPCPLLAIVNVLLLQRRIRIPSPQEIVTSGQLMEYIGDCILEESPKQLSEGAQLNYEQNMHDAIAIMNKLQTGLDVNVKFTGVSDFEFTPECIVFDLLSIGLYHGWLVDPQNTEIASAIGSLSYNQLVEKIIASKQDGAETQLVSEGLISEAFLEQTASQLTYHGLCELNSQLQDDHLCVFFRNNHFSTFHKHKDELFLLVTDQGFLTEDRVIWESLSSVDGDSYFVDAEFRTLPAVHSPPQPAKAPVAQQLSQEDQDYLVALSLQEEQDETTRGPQTHVYPGGPDVPQPLPNQAPTQQSAQTNQEWSDLQLAIQLQQEEERQQQQQQRRPQQVRPSPTRSSNTASQAQVQQRNGQQRTESSCIIL